MEGHAKEQHQPPYLPGLLEAIARGATVVTPGRRAANRLARQVDAVATRQGLQSWRAARILPWMAWVHSQWEAVLLHGDDTRIVLNREQELAVWKTIVLWDGSVTEQIAHFQAGVCLRTAALLATFGADSVYVKWGSAGTQTNDALSFYRSYIRFQEICAREGYLSAAALERELGNLIRRQRRPRETEVLLFDFPEFSPSRRQLVDTLRDAGMVLNEVNVATEAYTSPRYLRYPNSESELRACAQWVREQLEQAPQQTVRVVVPDLLQTRHELERELRSVVAPGNADVVHATAEPYEFSAGMPLHSMPLINDALLLLRWCTEPLSLDNAARLLRSSHLSLASSPEVGALLEVDTLRTRAPLRKELSLRQASALLHPHPASQRLMDLHRRVAELRPAASYASCAAQAQRLLQASGWPGEKLLDAEESQGVDAWQRALDTVASLDLFGRKTTWAAFLQSLEEHLSSADFVPAYRDLPVQVTGVEEAFGSPVDALWFLHAAASTWPAQAVPNPLLPIALQRDFGMPGVDSQRDEDDAALRLQHLLGSTTAEVRLSCSGEEEQDAGMPSPFVERVLSNVGVTIEEAAETVQAQPVEPQLEAFFDSTPLPALPLETELSGGVSILTAQAQCGFRAWAEKRLFSAPLEEEDAGLSPRERGDQVHAVLQAFWAATGSQQALRAKHLALDADGVSQRDRLLQSCIADVCTAGAAEGWDDAYLSVQKARLFRLLTAWLDYEETRPPFEVVQLEQEARNVTLGPLKLHMRVDRVDRVLATTDDGSEPLGTLLIDYKTGSKSNSPKEWTGERPDQPQLPAYATAAAVSAELGALNGIAFASVRAGKDNMQLRGVADAGLLPSQRQRNEVTFAAQKGDWRRHLEALAQAFAEGDATVEPKTFPRTCDTCGQRLLCRLDAATLLEADGDAWDSSDPEAE